MLLFSVCSKEPVDATIAAFKGVTTFLGKDSGSNMLQAASDASCTLIQSSSSSLVLLPLNSSSRNAKAKDHNARAGYGHLDLSVRHLQRTQRFGTYFCTALGLTLTPHTFWMLYICSAWM